MNIVQITLAKALRRRAIHLGGYTLDGKQGTHRFSALSVTYACADREQKFMGFFYKFCWGNATLGLQLSHPKLAITSLGGTKQPPTLQGQSAQLLCSLGIIDNDNLLFIGINELPSVGAVVPRNEVTERFLGRHTLVLIGKAEVNLSPSPNQPLAATPR